MTRGEAASLAAILALATALRLVCLGWHDLWADEGFSLWVASLPWRAAPTDFDMAGILSRDAHPPLFYLFLKGWMQVAPTASDFVARLPFALAGVGTVAATWWLGRAILPERAALLGAALMAVSQSAVMLDQEIRMYALLALFLTLAAALLPRVADVRAALGYFLALAAALYTHYLAAFALVGHAAWWLLAAWRRWESGPARRNQAVAAVCAVAAFLPWTLTYTVAQVRAGAGPPHEAPGLLDLPRALLALLEGLVAARPPLGAVAGADPGLAVAAWKAWLLLAVLLIPMVAALLRAGGSPWILSRPASTMLVCLSGVPLLLAWVAAIVGRGHFFTAKYFTFVLPPLWLLAAAGLLILTERQRPIASLAAGLCGAAILSVNAAALAAWDTVPETQKSRWRDAVAVLRAQYRPGDGVVVMNSFQSYVVDRYLRQAFGARAPLPVYLSSGEIPETPLPRRLQEAARGGRMWLLLSGATQVDPHMTLVARLHKRGIWLAERALPVNGQPDAGVVLLLWQESRQGR